MWVYFHSWAQNFPFDEGKSIVFSIQWKSIWENTIKHDNNKFFSIQLEWKRTPRLLHQFGQPTANDYISNSLEIVMLQCVHIASFQFQKPQIRTFCERLWLHETHENPPYTFSEQIIDVPTLFAWFREYSTKFIRFNFVVENGPNNVIATAV